MSLSNQIEERLVDRVLRAYEKMNMTEFWTLIQGLNQFLDAKRKICE